MWRANDPVVLNIPAAQRPADAITALQNTLQNMRHGNQKDPSEKLSGRDIILLISEHWLRWINLPWHNTFADQKTLQEAAWNSLKDAWQIREDRSAILMAIDDAPWGYPRAVVGIEKSLVDMLTATLHEAGAKKISVRPLISALTSAEASDSRPNNTKRKAPERNKAFFVIDESTISIAVIRQGRLQAVFTRPAGTNPATECAQLWCRLMLREAVTTGIERPEQTFDLKAALAATKTASPRHAPIFSDLPPRLNALTAGITITSLAALGLAGFFAWQAAHSLTENETIAHTYTPPQIAAKALTPTQQAQVRAVNRATRQLNVPVTALLRALPPRNLPGVSLLSLDITGNYGAGDPAIVKIAAEARTAADMTNYVAQLSAHPAISHAWLTQHKMKHEQTGRPYHFSVEATWKQ